MRCHYDVPASTAILTLGYISIFTFYCSFSPQENFFCKIRLLLLLHLVFVLLIGNQCVVFVHVALHTFSQFFCIIAISLKFFIQFFLEVIFTYHFTVVSINE